MSFKQKTKKINSCYSRVTVRVFCHSRVTICRSRGTFQEHLKLNFLFLCSYNNVKETIIINFISNVTTRAIFK